MKGKGGFSLFGIIASAAKNVKQIVDKWRNKQSHTDISKIQHIKPEGRQ